VELHVGTELPGGTLGSAYAGSLTVSGGQGPYMWAVASGALPPGLSLDSSSGTIAGLPQAYGSFAFGVSVTDVPSHVQATASATMIVAPKPVTITTVTLPDARVGDAYSANLAAGDGAAPLRWTIVVGTVPPGLTFDQMTGAITGTPRYPGNVQFTASVSDSWTPPMSATRTFTITTILEARPTKPDGSF
jgi:hypothetical protein